MLHVFKSDGFVYSGFCNLRRGLFAVCATGRERERVPGRERGASPEEVAGGICMAKMTKAKQPN
jgi:hypothetical protein